MRKQTVVVDTNILVEDPEVLVAFADAEVVIPIVVIEELDILKGCKGALGHKARSAICVIENLLVEDSILENGAIVRIDTTTDTCPFPSFVEKTCDNLIIGVAHHLMGAGHNVLLLSNDTNVRLKARILGLEASPWTSFDSLYKGYRELQVSSAEIDRIYQDGVLYTDSDLYPNEYVHMSDWDERSALGIHKDNGTITLLPKKFSDVWGATPKGREQTFAVNALLDSSIPLVTLTGRAGCGKTYLSLAVALQKVLDTKEYNRILITRALDPVGLHDIGFLPGDKEDKLINWMAGITDNLEQLLREKSNFELYMQQGLIELEALTYLRGRSLRNTFVIVDEAQNLTQNDAKTIVTRIGSNSKLVLVGDLEQIDKPSLDAENNGLYHTLTQFRPYPLAAHVHLSNSKLRSDLAALAARIL